MAELRAQLQDRPDVLAASVARSLAAELAALECGITTARLGWPRSPAEISRAGRSGEGASF